jgi:hypothetical protein
MMTTTMMVMMIVMVMMIMYDVFSPHISSLLSRDRGIGLANGYGFYSRRYQTF